MKFAATSDLHGQYIGKDFIDNVDGVDVLLIAGDVFEANQDPSAMIGFFNRLRNKHGVKRIVMTPGNHDHNIFEWWLLDHPKDVYESRRLFWIKKVSKEMLKKECNVDMLIDESIDIDGIKIYGTPWSTLFCNWAFMARESVLRKKYDLIPADVDIVISHSPPVISGCDIDVPLGLKLSNNCGSMSLTDAIMEKKPKYLFCGHIHSGTHNPILMDNNVTTCRNVSLLNEHYEQEYPVFTFEYGK